ncbi:hypothetical protein BDZ89DRAFT_289218 [Hymenopellis radicata]|nr:hypothetical protein BDZ89DRAFT_289218 [Hymenopellis radicata]
MQSRANVISRSNRSQRMRLAFSASPFTVCITVFHLPVTYRSSLCITSRTSCFPCCCTFCLTLAAPNHLLAMTDALTRPGARPNTLISLNGFNLSIISPPSYTTAFPEASRALCLERGWHAPSL